MTVAAGVEAEGIVVVALAEELKLIIGQFDP